jgi:hypothetical protein
VGTSNSTGRAIAKHDWKAEAGDQISFWKGDLLIQVEVDTPSEGWCTGRRDADKRRVGIFPSNYIDVEVHSTAPGERIMPRRRGMEEQLNVRESWGCSHGYHEAAVADKGAGEREVLEKSPMGIKAAAAARAAAAIAVRCTLCLKPHSKETRCMFHPGMFCATVRQRLVWEVTSMNEGGHGRSAGEGGYDNGEGEEGGGCEDCQRGVCGDKVLMMSVLQDSDSKDDPGAAAARLALQAAQAEGKSPGEVLVDMAVAYERTTGKAMKGAPCCGGIAGEGGGGGRGQIQRGESWRDRRASVRPPKKKQQTRIKCMNAGCSVRLVR